jgi:hypothetical protein
VLCGATSETDDGLLVFCELEAPHPGRFHDVLITALAAEHGVTADMADRYGEHYAWPNLEPDPIPGRDHFVHNVIAHPLLVLWPRVGRWLHERTEP